MSAYTILKLKFRVILLQLWNCWSVKSLILLPLRYYQQLTYWKQRGLHRYLSPFENFLQTIAVACTYKNLTTVCSNLHQRPNPKQALLGFYYNGRPAVLVSNPVIVKSLLSEDYSYNLEVLWHPDVTMNPILSKCPMFTTNLHWIQKNIWTKQRLDSAFHKLLSLKMMTIYRSSFSLLMSESSDVLVDLRSLSSLFAEQVFLRIGLGLTNLIDRDIKDAMSIFEIFKRTFETQITEPRDTILLMASDLARNDHKVPIVPPIAESEMQRLVKGILDRGPIQAAGANCLLFYLHAAGLSMGEIAHELYAFCFDLYVHLVCLGSLALRELAEDGGIQNKLSDALNTAEDHDGGKWLSETILNLPLLNKFVHEIRNRHPINGCMARICKAPMSIPTYCGSSNNLVLKKGELVFASTLDLTKQDKSLDLNYANPHEPVLHACFLMLIATKLRTSLLTPGNQLLPIINVHYDAILPENNCSLRGGLRPHRIRDVVVP